MNHPDQAPRPPHQRFALVAGIIMCLAISGFFVGLSAPMRDVSDDRESAVLNEPSRSAGALEGAVPAIDYRDLPATWPGNNGGWSTRISDLHRLPEASGGEVDATIASRRQSLATRAERRAYNGAPPTIPHEIDALSTAGCMACHGEGAVTATLRISKMPHPFYANCTQCHVEQVGPVVDATASWANLFAGLPAPEQGPRSFSGAPPLIPHSTWMRQDCLSCHGPTGYPGMQTTHPWQRQCLQCHAPSAELDQSGIESIGRFLPPLMIEESDGR